MEKSAMIGASLAKWDAASLRRIWLPILCGVTMVCSNGCSEPVETSIGYPTYGIALSADGMLLASTPDVSRKPELTLANTGNPKDVTAITGEYSWVFAFAFSPDGHILAFGDNHGCVYLWDVKSKKIVATFVAERLDTPPINGLAFTKDSRLLACGGRDETIQVFDLRAKKRLFVLRKADAIPEVMAFSPDGKTLAASCYSHDRTATDCPILLWDIMRKKVVRTLLGHLSEVTCMAYAPLGSLLATGSTDGTVKLWDTTTGKVENSLSHRGAISALAFSEDGKLMATAAALRDDGEVLLWDLKSMKKLDTFHSDSGQVLDIVFLDGTGSIAYATSYGKFRKLRIDHKQGR